MAERRDSAFFVRRVKLFSRPLQTVFVIKVFFNDFFRDVKNKVTGIDLSIPSHRVIPGLLSSTIEYHVVVVTNLSVFKSAKHKETDTVQFMVNIPQDGWYRFDEIYRYIDWFEVWNKGLFSFLMDQKWADIPIWEILDPRLCRHFIVKCED